VTCWGEPAKGEPIRRKKKKCFSESFGKEGKRDQRCFLSTKRKEGAVDRKEKKGPVGRKERMHRESAREETKVLIVGGKGRGLTRLWEEKPIPTKGEEYSSRNRKKSDISKKK